MFDLEKEHIQAVPEDLCQDLVGHLCTATVEARGGLKEMVRWGSHLKAGDDGVDVEVTADNEGQVGDFILRPETRLQVKRRKKRGVSAAVEAMKLSGTLYPSIVDVVSGKGCYVLVSFLEDPSPLRIRDFQEAMFREVSHITTDKKAVRFLGVHEILRWVNTYPTVKLWLREQLGLELHGWRPHGKWSIIGGDTEDTLITKPGVQIFVDQRGDRDLGIADGIGELRELVRGSQKAVRVLGLAGVGKTRIVQALFESCPIGNELSPFQVIYADCRVDQHPPPHELLYRLIKKGEGAFLVLDNCSPETHDPLAHTVQSEDSPVRLITVDSEVRHDKLSRTHVVWVRAKHTEAAVELVLRRSRERNVGRRNAEKIAKLAEGNALVAIALWENIGRNESIAKLSEDDLFNRLVGPDPELVKTAEALSLVYSVSTDTAGDCSELSVLGSLVGKSAEKMHYNGKVLADRLLVEDRPSSGGISGWQMIFLQAVANRLASDALRRMPREAIINAFDPARAPRLFQSHAHRISYLHDSEHAVSLVESWLSDGGPLSDLAKLDGKNAKIVCYAAAVAPRPVLMAIETWFREGQHTSPDASPDFEVHYRAMDALTMIARDENVFERCVDALTTLARRSPNSPVRGRAIMKASILFSNNFRWLPVGIKKRFDVISRYLRGDDGRDPVHGHFMLISALDPDETPLRYFPDYGVYRDPDDFPESDMSGAQLCASFLDLISKHAPGFPEGAIAQIQLALGPMFRYLWQNPEIRPALVDALEALSAREPWSGGWMVFLRERPSWLAGVPSGSREKERQRLTQLARNLRPRDPVDRICGRLLSLPTLTSLGGAFWETFPLAMPREELDFNARIALRLGKCAARMNPRDLLRLLSSLHSYENEHIYLFAHGVARKHGDPMSLWSDLAAELDKTGPKSHETLHVFLGIIDEAREHSGDLVGEILDNAVKHPKLRGRFATLQQRADLDGRTAMRLKDCLTDQTVDPTCFADIAWKKPYTKLPVATVESLLRCVASKPGGAPAVVMGLSSRFRIRPRLSVGTRISRLGLRSAAKALRETDPRRGHPPDFVKVLWKVLEICSRKQAPEADLRDVLRELIWHLPTVVDDGRMIFGVLRKMTARMPHVALDALFADPRGTDVIDYFLATFHTMEDSLFRDVGIGELLSWADIGDREDRLIQVAQVLWPLDRSEDSGELHLTPVAHELIRSVEDPRPLASVFVQSLLVVPSRENGGDIIARRRVFVRGLMNDPDPKVRKWAEAAVLRWAQRAEELKQMLQRRKPRPFE